MPEALGVTFEASKVTTCILHRVFGAGPPFLLLGPAFDCKLTMDIAIERLVQKARPKPKFYFLPLEKLVSRTNELF